MTHEQKKQLAIIGGAAVVAFLLWLLFRGRVGSVIRNASDYNPGMVPGSQLGDIIIQGGGPITIPGLDFGSPDLSMIGACCMDCAGGNSGGYQWTPRPAVETVYNMGASYNLTNYAGVKQSSGFSWGNFVDTNGLRESYGYNSG